MLQVVNTKKMKLNSNGVLVDFIRIMLVGKPNQSVNDLKADYAEYIPQELLDKKSDLNPKMMNFQFFLFGDKNKG